MTLLGVSPAVVARIIASGTLEVAATAESDDSISTECSPCRASGEGHTAGSSELSNEWLTAALVTALRASMEPLVVELQASRQTMERQAERLVTQAERLGRQAAELDAARSQIQTLTASAEAQSVETTPAPSWDDLHVYGVTAAVLVTLVLVATLVLR